MLKLSMDLNLMKDNVKNVSQDMKIIYIFFIYVSSSKMYSDFQML